MDCMRILFNAILDLHLDELNSTARASDMMNTATVGRWRVRGVESGMKMIREEGERAQNSGSWR